MSIHHCIAAALASSLLLVKATLMPTSCPWNTHLLDVYRTSSSSLLLSAQTSPPGVAIPDPPPCQSRAALLLPSHHFLTHHHFTFMALMTRLNYLIYSFTCITGLLDGLNLKTSSLKDNQETAIFSSSHCLQPYYGEFPLPTLNLRAFGLPFPISHKNSFISIIKTNFQALKCLVLSKSNPYPI